MHEECREYTINSTTVKMLQRKMKTHTLYMFLPMNPPNCFQEITKIRKHDEEYRFFAGEFFWNRIENQRIMIKVKERVK